MSWSNIPEDLHLTGHLPESTYMAAPEYEDKQYRKAEMTNPISHRVIEKRRRDRMNNCLADLSRLIPLAYLKCGQSRVEKTEIIELAIRHILSLNSQLSRCQELLGDNVPTQTPSCCQGQFYLGYVACTKELVHYLVDIEGFGSNDNLCSKLRSHLQTCVQRHAPELKVIHIEPRTHCAKASSNMTETRLPTPLSIPVPMTPSPTKEYPCEQPDLNDPPDSCQRLSGCSSAPENSFDFGATEGGSQLSNPGSHGSFYKFKRDIKLRFRADMRCLALSAAEGLANSDTSSSSNRGHSREKSAATNNSVQESYPRFDNDSAKLSSKNITFSSAHNDSGITMADSGSASRPVYSPSASGQSASECKLPGFVLDVSGTHYVPVIIPSGNISPPLSVTSPSTGVYHPISIPVNFCAPRTIRT